MYVCVFVCNFKVKFLMIEFVFKFFFTTFQSKYLIQRCFQSYIRYVCESEISVFSRTQYSSVAVARPKLRAQILVFVGARWPDQGWQKSGDIFVTLKINK
jgi:hypothetical protein